MSFEIERTDEEIQKTLTKAHAAVDSGKSNWSGQTYEEGVVAALRWVFGDYDDNPMDD